MPKKLTPMGIENLSVKVRTEMTDAECPGLVFRAMPSGRKSFFALMRTPDGLKRLSLGKWPDLSLKEARAEVRRLKQIGMPTAELSLENVIEKFVAFQKSRNKKTWRLQERQMELHVIPELGRKRPDLITVGDMYTLLRALDLKGPTVGENVFSILRQIFTWAERRGWVRGNPAGIVWADVQRSKPRDRILDDKELKAIWWACEDVFPAARDLTRTLLLLGQRRTETSLMMQDHLSAGIWTIPADVTKNGRQHQVPLSQMAIDILSEIKTAPYVFSSSGGDTSISSFSYIKTNISKSAGVSGWGYHDLRRTMTTRMAELGIPDHVVDRLLNHSVSRSTRAKHYDRYSYLKEKAEALETWATEVSRIISR